jgi:hypothetical protein
MRTLVWVTAIPLWAASFCALAQSNCSPTPCPAGSLVEMQFNFTVVPDSQGPGPEFWTGNVWNGPGPMPTTLSETFFVDPGSASGPLVEIPGTNGGLVLARLDESFAASNMTLTANGQVVQQLASGSFWITGDRANDQGPAASFFGGIRLPNGAGGSDFFTQYAQAPPDWDALLSTSRYNGNLDLFSISGAFGSLDVLLNGSAIPTAAVPEPGTLALCLLAGLGLLVIHRRRGTAAAGID